MKVNEYIPERLFKENIRNVYGIMGGGAAGLNDGFIKFKKINYICFHHEQSAGFAAVGESKVTNNLSVVNPTTGCAGTNCITAVLDAWQDSLPVLFISGNVPLGQTSRYINMNNNINIRKYGTQEHDIINTVDSITKYSKLVEKPEDLPYELDFAIYTAKSGRMGPVWLDIPSDVQNGLIPDNHRIFDESIIFPEAGVQVKPIKLEKIFSNNKFKRPLILAGNGIKLSGSKYKFKSFIEEFQIPFVTTYLAIDIINYNHVLNIGTIGMKGSRAGNFALQNCDYLVIIGCSLNNTHIGYDPDLFANKAYKIMIDIDDNESKKGFVNINEFYNCDISSIF